MWKLRSLFAICPDSYKQIEAEWSTLSYICLDNGRTRSAISMLVRIEMVTFWQTKMEDGN